MEQKPEEIKVSGKHLVLRIVLLVLAFIVAVTAFAIGFREMTNKEPGYYEIVAAKDESAPLYTNGIKLVCYFDGKSNEIKQEFNAVTALYEESMGRIYRLLDAYHTYDGYVNLATLNQNPNTVWQIPVELYTVLTDVQQRLDEYGLNLYDAVLRSNWEAIRYLEEPLAYDPLYNPDTAERLEQIMLLVGDRDAVKLEIMDPAERKVCLTETEAFMAGLSELEETGPVLELGILREAYTLMYVAGKLNAAGFTKGYLTTDSGLTVLLKDTETAWMEIDTYAEGTPKGAAELEAKGGSAVCILRSFPREGEFGYYAADGVLRHPYLSENGEPNRTLLTAMASSDDGDVVGLCVLVLKLYEAESGLQEELADRGNPAVGWILAERPQELLTAGGLSEKLKALEPEGIRIISVS